VHSASIFSRGKRIVVRSMRRLVLLGVVTAAVVSSGCSVSKWTVRPHQRELLADKIMSLDAVGQEQAAEQHILENREGAVGGNGTSGGGCGCN
jgi:Domain of unknown function (DUF4266)